MWRTWLLSFLYLGVAAGLWWKGSERRWWLFLVGAVSWTFAEYWFHRYLHWTEGVVGLDIDNHKHHHDDPKDDAEIHYTFAESMGTTLLLGLVCFVFGIGFEWLSGFLVAYVVYEWLHIAAHREVWGLSGLEIVEYHREHHRVGEKDGTMFGFTTRLWDWCFGTLDVNSAELQEK